MYAQVDLKKLWSCAENQNQPSRAASIRGVNALLVARLWTSLWENPLETDVGASVDVSDETEEEEWEHEVVGWLELLVNASIEEGCVACFSLCELS